MQKYLDDNTAQYFIVSKIECPCCCIVKNLLTYKNYLNIPEEQVIIIYDNSDKQLLSYIRDNKGNLNNELLIDDNETISDTYPCVFVKEDGKFKYLEGGKDGMIKRFVLTLKSDYSELYSRIVENIKVKLENPSESSDIFCRCTESDLKPNEQELQKHIDKLNILHRAQTAL